MWRGLPFAPFTVFLLPIAVALAIDCSEITQVYQQSSCCTGDADTCLRAIPLCDDVTNGKVCFDGTDVVVKGLLDAFEFTNTQITLKKHIIPDTNGAYDLGNAEYKIRYLFESD